MTSTSHVTSSADPNACASTRSSTSGRTTNGYRKLEQNENNRAVSDDESRSSSGSDNDDDQDDDIGTDSDDGQCNSASVARHC